MPSVRAALLAAVSLTLPFALAPATAAAGTGDDRPFPDRVFAASSPFYQELPDDTPVAWNSSALVDDLVAQSHEYWGTPWSRNVDISTHQWSPTMYVAHDGDPIASYRSNNCQGKWPGWDTDLLDDHLAGVHVPGDAVPDDSADGSMVVYNPDADTVTETWVTQKQWDGSYSVCWGGTIRHASQSLGQHDSFYGVSGSGLSMAGYVIRADELQRGHIDHVIALNIPRVKAGASWPATRSDGDQGPNSLAEGQLLRLPKSVDIDAMNLSPAARTIAKAAQEYGIMVTDRGGAVTFVAQNAKSFATNPYTDIFRGRWPSQEMAGDPARGEQAFPLDQLVALPLDTHVQGVQATATPAPAPSSAPSSAPTPGPTQTPTTPAPAPATPSLAQPQPKIDIRQSMHFGSPVTDSTGATWAARTGTTIDTYNIWEKPSWRVPTGTASPQLYQSTAWGMRHYGVDVPNGTYDVTLYMVEDWWNHAGDRVFDVTAEGKTVLADVDTWAWTGGMDRALERTFPVTVTDGHLDLGWVPKVDNPLVNAIRIQSR